ncbi:MAG: hypothetical protein IKE05_01505 [Clostridia bacterium]|nr:hypothetical protein [Clostridia bacterium]
MPYQTQVQAALGFLESVLRGNNAILDTNMSNWKTVFGFSHATETKGKEAIKRLSKIATPADVKRILISISGGGLSTPTKAMYHACVIAIPRRTSGIREPLTDSELTTTYGFLYDSIMQPIKTLFTGNPDALKSDTIAQGLDQIVTDLKEFPNYIKRLPPDKRRDLL